MSSPVTLFSFFLQSLGQGHELGQTPGDGEGQGSLAGCSPWGREHDLATEQQQLLFPVRLQRSRRENTVPQL